MTAKTEGARSLVRPIVTIIMVIVFCVVAMHEIIANHSEAWGSALIALASSVISYWFGERSKNAK